MLSTTGWFDAFRENGGPTLYTSDNRTSVSADHAEVLVYLAFFTLLVAFLAIVPGIRKERVITVITVIFSLLVGASILIGVHGSRWHVGQGRTHTYYRSFSTERLRAVLGVHVGLYSVNVTYVVEPGSNDSTDIHFNEEFAWPKPTSLRKEYHDALAKGLPFPILTVLDYLSQPSYWTQEAGGFQWGRMYRRAGDWTQLFLWAAFAAWLLADVLLCAVPRYGAYCTQLTGALMVLSAIVYGSLLPEMPLVIPLEGNNFLRLSLGWNFWLTLIVGIMAIIFGGSMAVVDVLYPSKFPTILEVDYDTPYRYFVAQGNQSSRNTSAANSTTNTPLPLPRYQKMGNSNEYSGPSSSGLNQLGSEDGDSITHIIDDTEDGIDNAAFEQESDDGCVMVDGKRAVTLQDFGKFADRAQSPAGSTAGSVAAKRRVLGSSIGFNVKDISIDMHTDSSKW
ncbi:dual oxidase maturation factor 1 isoform X2 [Rhipicephalus microplus]|nr:dual oxidase maturation factor 1-like [Rhipicephalus microplus]XP_037285234.1 dual oxidase maturation factor 1-like [Rhipicephalus microplus]